MSVNYAIKKQKEKDLETKQKKGDYFIEKGKLFSEKRKYIQAIKAFRKAVNIDPENGSAHFELGKTYYIEKRYSPAIKEFKNTAALNKKHYYSCILLAKAYREAGKYYSAAKEFKKLIKDGFNNKEVQDQLMTTYQMLENKEAITDIKKLSKLDPADSIAHISLGRIYRDNNEYDLALKEFREALHKGTDSIDVHYEIAKTNFESGEYQDAIKEVETILDKMSSASKEMLDLNRQFRTDKNNRDLNVLKSILKKIFNLKDASKYLWMYYNDTVMKKKIGGNTALKKTDISDSISFAKQVRYKKEKNKVDLRILTEEVNNKYSGSKRHIKLGQLYRNAGNYAVSLKEFKKAQKKETNSVFLKNKILNEIETLQKKPFLNPCRKDLLLF